ncbi:MAG: type I restriction endonuclease subunit R [Bacteroidetes bacterium]|nr:type I restriction endonuclease subunit R [Bacteroidota bacterium]
MLNKQGREEPIRVKFIDFKKASNNNFTVVSQLWIKGMPKFRRPDLIIYVNGIPLVFIELKNSNIEIKDAYDVNLTTYLKEIPQLFPYNAFCILSNAMKQNWVHSNLSGVIILNGFALKMRSKTLTVKKFRISKSVWSLHCSACVRRKN